MVIEKRDIEECIEKFGLNKEVSGFVMLADGPGRDTSLERLWGKQKHAFISDERYKNIHDVYQKRMQVLKDNWTALPRAAVQGDIYGNNNLAWKDGELCVFDFNLSGDEALIGDILLCWFRTIFGYEQELYKNEEWCRECWKKFMYAYESERPLESKEKEVLADVYAILGTVYYVKLLVFYLEHNIVIPEEWISYFETLITIRLENLEW